MQAGDVVANKYRLNRVLGTGGMATVWAATNVFTERDVALKVLLPQIATSKEAVNRFLQEAKVSARINHPNIIDIIDVAHGENGALFLVMELLTGVSLDTALRRQTPPMTSTELVFVMVEVARALAAAHAAGVVHRDLKPTNIFLHRERSGKPIPKVLDFGVSKFYEEERGRTALTVAGTVLGSPMYMSPEQARGESQVDGRTDIFSFGAMLFEALLGFRPYDAPNFNALIVQIATKKPRDIDQEAPELPASLRAVVKQCLQPSPKDRPQRFEEVAEALMAALPELEQAPWPLPCPESARLPQDPEATNALPVIRASDRPPPLALQTPIDGLSRGLGASGEAQSAGVRGLLQQRKMQIGAALVLAAALFSAGLLGGSCGDRKGTLASAPLPEAPWGPVPRAPGNVAALPPPAAEQPAVREPSAAPATSAAPAADPVAIDTLPVLPKRVQTGRITLSSNETCVLFVDGSRRGKVPLLVLDLSVGTHVLTCNRLKGGGSKSVQLTIEENQKHTHLFRF